MGLGLHKQRFRGNGMGVSAFKPFIIEVKTDNAGVSNNNQFTIARAIGDYDIVAKQNGNVVETFSNLSGEQILTFANGAGTYILEITPKSTNPFTAIEYNNDKDNFKIINIITYGDVAWTYMSFFRCSNLTSIGDRIYNGAGITSFSRCFHTTFPTNVINIQENFFWDCPNVLSFNQAFRGNGNISFSPRLFEKCTLVERFGFCFRDVTIPTITYSKMMINLEATNVKDNVPFQGGDSQYDPNISDSAMGSNLTAGQARAALLNRGWTFTDNGSI